jgi:polyketide biosynthesis enoyl-CoA hydratase PksH
MHHSITVTQDNGVSTITLAQKTLTSQLIAQLLQALDEAAQDSNIQVVVLKGSEGVFCTGLDFVEACQQNSDATNAQFLPLLKRITLLPKVVIAQVEGQVTAGGIGLMAACDVVVASPESKFSLSEALWGLLPAVVVPFLIRRTGFQPAFMMTITTLPIDAKAAKEMRLVDFVEEHPARFIKRLVLRVNKINSQTVGDIKQYFRSMWIANETMEQAAMDEFNRLIIKDEVRNNMTNFVEKGLYPWEKNQ